MLSNLRIFFRNIPDRYWKTKYYMEIFTILFAASHFFFLFSNFSIFQVAQRGLLDKIKQIRKLKGHSNCLNQCFQTRYYHKNNNSHN